jgi:hypothetical protein
MMMPPREPAATTQQGHDCCDTGVNNNMMPGDNTPLVNVEENANATEKKEKKRQWDTSRAARQKDATKKKKKKKKTVDLVQLHPNAIQAARRKIRDYFKTKTTSANLLQTNNNQYPS